MSKTRIWIAGIIISSAIVAALINLLGNENAISKDSNTLNKALATDDAQFSRVTQARTFIFPEDHGPHPEYKTEWWYVTGNVETSEGRPFGYQVTFFRNSLAASAPESVSQWASNQFYMAHVAVSDIAQQKFYSRERFARAALGLAGAQVSPDIKVWLEDWSLQGSGSQLFPMTISIKAADFSISLNMNTEKNIILQGNDGVSQKGPASGNASYYYSYTRLTTEGTIRVGENEFSVSGSSWLDREWSTRMLPKNVVGWDWFSIQLDNNTELMFYRMRMATGETTKFSKGSLVLANGDKINLNSDQVRVLPKSRWQSQISGMRYPIVWEMKIPAYNIELNIKALMPNQELDHSLQYWEGAIKITGKYQQQPVKGKGYLEMTGYES